MKVLLPFFCCLLLAGCATKPTDNILTPFDSGRQVTVAVGHELVVELPSNRSTGFRWNEQSQSDPVLTLVGEPSYVLSSSPPLGMQPMTSVAGKEIWRFRAAKLGHQTLRLNYVRPWDKDLPPAQTLSFDVLVVDHAQ